MLLPLIHLTLHFSVNPHNSPTMSLFNTESQWLTAQVCIHHQHYIHRFSAFWLRSSVVWEFPRWHSGKESDCNTGNSGEGGSIPGSGRSPGGGHGNPLKYSCLKNPMNRGAWRSTVHGVTEGQTQLSTFIVKKVDRTRTRLFSSRWSFPSFLDLSECGLKAERSFTCLP